LQRIRTFAEIPFEAAILETDAAWPELYHGLGPSGIDSTARRLEKRPAIDLEQTLDKLAG